MRVCESKDEDDFFFSLVMRDTQGKNIWGFL